MKATHRTSTSPHPCHTRLAAAVLASVALVSCSPYRHSDSSQMRSTEMDSLGTSYSAANKRIAAEQRLNHRLEWSFTRPELDFGPGCEVNAAGSVVCDLIQKGSVSLAADASTPIAA